ncbi:MAG TPA: hypothetical protein VGL74_09235 [Terriglobales bacterium]|jgi:hypothetical protein
MGTKAATTIAKVADEVWVAAALLHQKHPECFDFSIEEIMESARGMWRQQGENLRPGIYVHIVQHCVANRPPNPGRYRMLVETGPGRRRLFRPGDYFHPEREGAKTTPERDETPYGYNGLLSWYKVWCSDSAKRAREEDPLLALRGSGKHIWADEHADEYVRRIREGWE